MSSYCSRILHNECSIFEDQHSNHLACLSVFFPFFEFLSLFICEKCSLNSTGNFTEFYTVYFIKQTPQNPFKASIWKFPLF